MKKILAAILTLTLILGLFACSGGSDEPAGSDGEAKAMEITIATPHPNNEKDPVYIYCKTFADLVTEKTEGRITFDIQGDSVLGDDVEIAEGLTLGTLDMGITSNAAISGYDPAHQLYALPFLFDDDEQANAFIDSDIAAEMNQGLESKGMKVMSILDGGFRQSLNTKKTIKAMADFKGMKWRVPPMDLFTDTFNALGANATPMGGAEVFTGLQQGTIDGCEFPVSSIYSMQLYAAAKYIDMTNHMFAAWYMCTSDDLWNKLSAEEQEIFSEAAKAANEASRKAQMESVESQLAEIEKAGAVVNRDVNTVEMRKAVQPILDSYRDKIGAELYDKAMDYVDSLRK